LSDGKSVAQLVPAQDHKRVGEGDTGANTGGMGVYSTDAILEPEMQRWILDHIACPTVHAMAEEGTPFVGVLYIGLMMTARGPQVLEFNARFGDPETQALLMRLDGDIVDALEACVNGRLAEVELRWKPGASACVIACSGGYPGGFKTGFEIRGLDAARRPGVEIFHSGTALSGGVMRTSGGRVLGASAVAATLSEALALAYGALEQIEFDGMFYRRDIGFRAVSKSGPD
jgi:phosphoribosylamine--glycine ligase